MRGAIERVERSLKRFISASGVTLIVALVGMVTGLTSLYITWRSTSEEAEFRLAAFPSTGPSDITPQGLGVRVELVNESLRPIVLRSAELVLDDQTVSKASGWISDVGLLENAASEPSRLVTSQRSFPIGLQAREGKSVVIVMDLWSPFLTAASETDKSTARGTFRQLTATLASLPREGESSRLELRLDHVPGGSHAYPVLAASTPTSSVEAMESAAALLRRIPQRFWIADLHGQGKHVTGLALRRRFAGADEIDLAQLDVWNVRTPFRRKLERPVIARQQTLFPLPALPPGAYVATFRVNGQVVAYKSFAVPSR